MEVLEMLAKNEELIGHLYMRYADRFPEHKDFWIGLAVEETEHAKWIRTLASQQAKGVVEIDDKRFKKEAIGTYHRYLSEEIGKVSSQDLPLRNALTVALYIEKSLIEQEYFEVLRGDSAEVREVLDDLEAATKIHLKQVQEVWSEYR